MISLNFNTFDNASDETIKEMDVLLRALPLQQFFVKNLCLQYCELTTDTFMPFIGLLKFVEKIDLYHNDLKYEDLCQIIKVRTI